MILHPSILALLFGSLCISAIALLSVGTGVRILMRWNLNSGSSEQIKLEQRTSLVSTILAYVMVFEVLSLFLFIFTADEVHPLFTGAMCASGSLSVNDYGYPLLLVKLATCLACGLWLMSNSLNGRGEDYPLIRPLYVALMCMTVFFLADTILTFAYFLNLKADQITSCCGSLFSINKNTIASEIAGFPARSSMHIFTVTTILAMVSGVVCLLKKRGAYVYAFFSGLLFPLGIIMVIAFISPYYYDLPTHHCPFDILQPEYRYIGYFLYAVLFMGSITGMEVGILSLCQKHASLQQIITVLQPRLCLFALICQSLFVLLCVQALYASVLPLPTFF